MRWLKKKIRRWLDDEAITIDDSAKYPMAASHNNFGESQSTVQIFRALNGTILVLHTNASTNKPILTANRTTMYVLKDGESVQDAVATLLVKARLDNL